MELTEVVATELEGARARSLDLLAPLAHDDLVRQHSPLMSPLVWDLAHVGNYEDQWLLRALGGDGPGARYDELYDAFRHPRRTRSGLPILGPDAARDYIGVVRDRVLDHLGRADLAPDAADPLARNGFVYGMVVQHEHQHDETMLATLQLASLGSGRQNPTYGPDSAGQNGAGGEAEVLVAGGPFVMGTDSDPWAYDNERPAHVVDVPPFLVDTTPVTNAAFAAYLDDVPDAEPPQFWERDGAWWLRHRFGTVEPVPPDEPVQHVSWHTADAYARWAGKRLPTEAEWEKAAKADGCLALVGQVWEWTASDFSAYPGFRSFPYREYSEVFFGTEYKVLRGGSWATHPTVLRTTFRNWDYPIRRQIFAGFRCARDVTA